MTQGHEITITPAGQHIEVTLGGEKLAASDHAVVLAETGLPPRYYFPRDDVRMDLLTPTDTHSHCPFKGDASYWSVTANGTVHEDLVWSYPEPITQSEGVRELLCFWTEKAPDLKIAVG